MRRLVAVLLVGLLGLGVSSETKGFDFYAYFQGEWEVQKSTWDGGETTFDELRGHYSIQKDNSTQSILLGRYYDNDTSVLSGGDVVNELDIYIDFETVSRGVFKAGPVDSETSPLFSFDFILHENGMGVSHGEWSGQQYQFSVAPQNSFTITIMKADKEVVVYTGRRILPVVEKTFFQQYGMMFLMGGFLIFNMFVQRSVQSKQQAMAAGGAAPAAAKKRN